MHTNQLSCLILLTLVGFISALDYSYRTSNDVYAEIRAYQQERVFGLQMARISSPITECYDHYMPLINAAADSGRASSELCITTADNERDEAINGAEDQRPGINADVDSIKDTLSGCQAEEDVLEFLSCLIDSADGNKAKIDEITEKASSLSTSVNEALNNIKEKENTCIGVAIDDAKEESNRLFDELQVCLINGGLPTTTSPDPETSTSEPSTSPDPESSESSPSSSEPSTSPDPESSPSSTEPSTSPDPESSESSPSSSEPSTSPDPESSPSSTEPSTSPDPESSESSPSSSEPSTSPDPESSESSPSSSEPSTSPDPTPDPNELPEEDLSESD